jgi:hypothetical protein
VLRASWATQVPHLGTVRPQPPPPPSLRRRYRSFLFTGHGDAQLEGLTPTLGFTGLDGGLEAVHADSLAELLGSHSPRVTGGTLELVFLNGCYTEDTGRKVHAAGVPHVVCWQTRVHDKAARLLASSFFSALSSSRSYAQAFEHAISALKLATRPGKLADGIPSSVPIFEIRDPVLPPRAETNFSPPPVATGVPLLLCETAPRDRSFSGSGRLLARAARSQSSADRLGGLVREEEGPAAGPAEPPLGPGILPPLLTLQHSPGGTVVL